MALGLATALCAPPAGAQTLRWASQGEPQTMDPHAQNEGLTNNINQHIYERLVSRDPALAIVPGLAVAWQMLSPTAWRFELRRGVRFHDGAPFTADDVVFSIERAQHPHSLIAQFARAVGKPVKIDDYTVELRQDKPNPVLLQHLDTLFIMSKRWCLAHKVERPLDFKAKEETHAARHANGTGPFALKSRQPGVKTVLTRNPHWWGRFAGNVAEVVHTPIAADATRVSALLSGAIDLLQDPPLQDVERLSRQPGIAVVSGAENRVVFLGMDQFRDELIDGNAKDAAGKNRNPFKDRRVRQALYRAIDADAIRARIMQGQSQPTGCLMPSPAACTDPALEARLAYDPPLARRLLAEAGYPNGFSVGLDCPNNRYVNDAKICQAVAAMLAQIGVRVRLTTSPKATYFPKLERHEASFYLLGWGGAITDAQTTLDPVMHSFDARTQKGSYNYGRFSDRELDAAIDAAASEMDGPRRQVFIAQALRRHHDQVFHIPLHRQAIPWAARANVKPVHRADNYVMSHWIQID
jgi:peptide/nickel transport system substrate-binding protein